MAWRERKPGSRPDDIRADLQSQHALGSDRFRSAIERSDRAAQDRQSDVRAKRPNKNNSRKVHSGPNGTVDPDTVLTLAAPFEGFTPIGRRNPQIIQHEGVAKHAQLAARDGLDIGG
jgi:hypothetical protein